MGPFALLAAAPTSDQIFKSMGDAATSDVNPAQVLAVIAAAVGLAVLLSVFKKRQARPDARAPDQVNNPGKLLRQLAKEAGLRRREVRELKKLAAIAGVEHPLTLLLCPSLMKAAIAKRRGH